MRAKSCSVRSRDDSAPRRRSAATSVAVRKNVMGPAYALTRCQGQLSSPAAPVRPRGNPRRRSEMDTMDLYRRAQDEFDAVLAAVPDSRWDAPSACAEWSVRDV